MCRNEFSCLSWWDVVSGHSSNDICTQILRRVFQVKELPLYFQKALPSRISPKSVLKFHSAQTSQMRNFDLYFPERLTFFFSDVCLTHCSPSESYSWIDATLWRLSVLWYTTQLSHTFHNSNCSKVFTLFRLFVWLFFNLPAQNLHPNFVEKNWANTLPQNIYAELIPAKKKL